MSLEPHELIELKDIFKLEAEEHLQTFSRDLALLESGRGIDSAAIDRLYRAAHSLKGAARMLGLEDIEFLAAELEARVGQIKRHEIEIKPELLNELRLTLNRLRTVIEANAGILPAPQPRLLPVPATDKLGIVPSRTQVETERLDELLLISGELEMALKRLSHRDTQFSQLREKLAQQNPDLLETVDQLRQNLHEDNQRFSVVSAELKAIIKTLYSTKSSALTLNRIYLLEVAGQRFSLDVNNVLSVQEFSPEVIQPIGQPRFYLLAGQKVLISELAEILGLSGGSYQPQKRRVGIVIGTDPAAPEAIWLIDKNLGVQEVIVKPFGPPIRRVRFFNGQALLSDGSLCLNLMVADILEKQNLLPSQPSILPITDPALIVERRILVVDDSLTTRALERNILEAAGYRVSLVTNGIEALEMLLTDGPFDLVVADVQMPHMDGFELTETIRRDERIPNRLPVVLLTSLADEASIQRGMLAGANAYLTKGSFDHLEFLKTVRHFT